MAFPKDRGDISPEVFTLMLLAAAVRNAGGELRLHQDLLESITGGECVFHDWNHGTHELVLRIGSKSANLLGIPAQEKWQKPKSPALAQTALIPSQPLSSVDDERVMQIEKDNLNKRLIRNATERTKADFFSSNLEDASRNSGKPTA